jgi:hypothetical protein
VDSFTYISVLLSIVLGLAITRVLLAFRDLILTRAKVKLYIPTLIWSGIALLIPIQAWWADFAMRKHPNWTFLALLVIMLQAISIYMIAALVLPDISGQSFVDLREHFFAHRSWFFGALLAAVVFSLLKDPALNGHLPHPVDGAFQIAFCAAAILAAIIRSEWFHKLLAPVMGLLFIVYIAFLFGRLDTGSGYRSGLNIDLRCERPVDWTSICNLEQPGMLLSRQGSNKLNVALNTVDLSLLGFALGTVGRVDF